MNSLLKNAWEILSTPDHSLSPVAQSDRRQKALVDGLTGLAQTFNREIEFTYINSNGELAFEIKNGRYGEELAALLSTIPRRTGVQPTTSPVLPENSWCWINHFDAEKLIRHYVTAHMKEPKE